MNGPQFSFIKAMGYELHVTEWGTRKNPPLVMWHGLARTGRDFDELALALSDRFFVICPDTIGRGLSSWSKDPKADYHIEFYARLAIALLDHYDLKSVAWLGTSMGGAIGMHLAAGPHAGRLACLIINDIGPEVPQTAIDRIVHYVCKPPVFDHLSQAHDWLCNTYAPFGPASPEFWRRMTRTSIRRTDQGKITLHYDPQITQQFSSYTNIKSTWSDYAKITLPTHVIRGVASDILTTEILTRMQQEGPRPKVTQITDSGHAPTLSQPKDIQLVRNLLTVLHR